MKPNLSVFFPAFNEEENITSLVTSTYELLKEIAEQFEIIIVDDGSRDRTSFIVKELAIRYPEVRLIQHSHNLGYGAALISGFKHCRYELVFFSDADNQFSLRDLRGFLGLIQDCDAVLGYRKKRSDPLFRSINTWAWTLLVNILFQIRIKDVNCAFKLFRKSILEKSGVLSLTSQGALINTELLVRLRKVEAKIIQAPVSHYPRRYGQQTGANFKVILSAFKELIRYLLNRF